MSGRSGRGELIGAIGAAVMAAVIAAITLASCSLTINPAPMGGMNHGDTSESDARRSDVEHNRFDLAFTMMMIPHHEQAIDMADLILAKEAMDPGVVDLAGRIKAGQAPEITLMESWLDDWGVGMSGIDGMGHGGMMSDADMDALDQASGTEATRLFLEQMIEHHQDAIDMAEREIDRGQYAPTIDLAKRIVTAQKAEITEMEQLLAAL